VSGKSEAVSWKFGPPVANARSGVGLDAVRAHLHVPEERLAELDCCDGIPDELAEVVRPGDRDCPQVTGQGGEVGGKWTSGGARVGYRLGRLQQAQRPAAPSAARACISSKVCEEIDYTLP
jgi:hypothetical protein